MTEPAIIVTGASGFVGRHLLEELKTTHRIFAIARRSQRDCGAPIHPNIAWMRVDVTDTEGLARTFREIATAGGAKLLLHLAAYYDFAGENPPEYRRTNVEGTRNVLEIAKGLDLARFVFASSVAACSFPRPEGAVTEATPPDGSHVYAWSKRQGEDMLRGYRGSVPSCTVRFGAVFSDWCEYPPLYVFLTTWLGRSWKRRILAGRGASAIPYVHIRDVVSFLRRLVARHHTLEDGEVLVASTPGCSSHFDLYTLALRSASGRLRPPVTMPKPLCGIGLAGMTLAGALTGRMPFERPWMLRYVDRQLTVDNARTCARLGWSPAPRYRIERRMPYLVERMQSEPLQWHARNAAAMRRTPLRPDLLVSNVLASHEDDVVEAVLAAVHDGPRGERLPHFRALDRDELSWRIRLYFLLLLTSIQSGDRMRLTNLAGVADQSLFRAGFTGEEVTALLELLEESVRESVSSWVDARPLADYMFQRVTVPILLGKDEVLEQYERFLAATPAAEDETAVPPAEPESPARRALEETIWSCLVHRG